MWWGFMNNQEDPMRTAVKQVHQCTTAEVENQRRSSIQKWLFWAMFLWPVIMVMVSVFGQFGDYVLFFGSPVVAAILAGFALRRYPATRKFLKTLVGLLLITTVLWGGDFFGVRHSLTKGSSLVLSGTPIPHIPMQSHRCLCPEPYSVHTTPWFPSPSSMSGPQMQTRPCVERLSACSAIHPCSCIHTLPCLAPTTYSSCSSLPLFLPFPSSGCGWS